MTDGPGRVETLGAHVHAVHDAAATEHAERIVHGRQALLGLRSTANGQETVSLRQRGRAQELVRVPPEGRAAGGAARAQDALVQAVQLLAVFRSLQTLDSRRRRVVLPVALQL